MDRKDKQYSRFQVLLLIGVGLIGFGLIFAIALPAAIEAAMRDRELDLRRPARVSE